MHFAPGNLYHIYNRGNNRRPIFFNEGNYNYFLGKMRQYLTPHCNLLAYVLMPNHFHFLIEADERTTRIIENPGIPKSALSEGIRLMLSSYSKGINKQQGFTGNLIQQKTKAKLVYDAENLNETLWYALTCFHYIHQNPLRARLVERMEDSWATSFPDYMGLRKSDLCGIQRATGLLDLRLETFLQDSYAALSEEYLKEIW